MRQEGFLPMAARCRAYRGVFRALSGVLGGRSARAFAPEWLPGLLGLHPGSLPLGRFMQMAPRITSTTVDPGGVRLAQCLQDPGPALPGVLRSSGSLPGVPYIPWLCTSKRTVYDLTVAGQLLRIGPDFLINHFIHRSSCVFALSSRLSFSASGPSVHYRTQ